MDGMVVGLDVGATRIKGAVVNRHGTVVRRQDVPTPHPAGQDEFVACVCSLADSLAQGRTIEALGLGIAGILDPERNVLIESPNMPGLNSMPLRQVLEQRLQLPVQIENDVNAAAFGELIAGAGRGHDNFLFFTLGTGIGSGLVLDGRLWIGEQGKAGEFGHVTVALGGEPCGCGKRGCLEAYSSGTAIVRMARHAALNIPGTALQDHAGDLSAITPETVYRHARAGDSACRDIFRSMSRSLAAAIADVNNLLDIHMFIVGGGISRACDMFCPMIMDELDQLVFSPSRGRIMLVTSQMGNDAGVCGAGLLAHAALQEG